MNYTSLVALLALVAGASASCSTASLAASISNELSIVSYSYAPDIYTIGTILSTIELSSPSLSYVESVIASYEYSSPSIVSFFESCASYPSQVTDISTFETEETSFSTLFSAVASLYSIEASHTSLTSIQSTLQSAMEYDSSITQDLSAYTAFYYSTIYSASEVIDEAAITSPSIISEVLSVSADVSSAPTVSAVISSLSYYFYSLPSTVDSYVLSYISSPSTVAPSEVSYLSSYYPSIFSYVTYITTFTYSYPSVVSALTDYLSVASSVSSLGSAVSVIDYYQCQTLNYQESVLSSAAYYWPSVYTELGYLSLMTVSSSTLGSALSYLEGTFYNSPEVACSLFWAIESPSSYTDTEEISYEEMSHQSFVSAVTELISFESAYPSDYTTLYYIIPYLTYVFADDGTLLTAYSYVSSAFSASTVSAEYSLTTLYSVDSDWSTVLYYIGSATYYSPTLSCDESVVASYAYSYPTVVETLWSVITDASAYTTEASTIASLEASYSSVVSALISIYSAASSYTSLYSSEGSFIYIVSSDSSALTQYDTYSSAVTSDATYLWFYSSSPSVSICSK